MSYGLHRTAEGRETILVVEETVPDSESLNAILRERGYRVIQTEAMQDALDRAREHVPDMVLVNMSPPGEDGFHLCRMMHRETLLQDIPFVIVSECQDSEARMKAFYLGAVDYITKPFNKTEALARISNHLELKKNRDMIRRYNEDLEALLEQRTRSLIRAERHAVFSELVQGIVGNLSRPLQGLDSANDGILSSVKQLRHLIESRDPLPRHESLALLDEIEETGFIVHQTALRMEELIDTLMLKGRRDRMDRVAKIDLNSIIRQEIRFLESDLNFRDRIERRMELTSEPVFVEAIPAEIAQVFQNIVCNAIDAVSDVPEPFLRVVSGSGASYGWFMVEDNGPGIPAPLVPRIFDPYFSTRRGSTGYPENVPADTGLGLFFCNHVIRGYGGEIILDTKEGMPTRFTVRIPNTQNGTNL